MPGDIEGVAVPGDGLIKQKDLDDKDAPQSQNSYTEEEKFEMALTMAESLADLHGFRDGVMYVLICKFFFSFLFVISGAPSKRKFGFYS